MLKRLTALMAAVFFLLTAFTSIAYAEDFPGTNITTGTNSSTIVSDAETNYGILNENKAQLDAPQSYGLGYVAPPLELQVTVSYNGQSIPTSYGELSYGNPCGDYSDGHYRYLGYTYEGDYYTNIAYPPDAVPNGVDFETQQWIASPWQYNTLGAITVATSPWEGQQSYTDPKTGVTIPTNTLIQAGMWYLNQTTGVGGVDGEKGSGYAFNLGDGNSLWQNLYKYADIMMPCTETTWGMSRMFHMYNGYPYYVDIPLPPLALAELPFLDVEPASATVSVGQTQWYHDYYFPADGGQPVDVTTSSTWMSTTSAIATIGADTGGAVGVAPGTTNLTATYTDAQGNTLSGTASITVTQGVLTVTPATQTIPVGSTASYISTYYQTQDDANAGADGTVVTLQSTWMSSDTSIATPASTPGLFNGVSPGTVTVTATYSPGDGASLTAYYPSGGSQGGGQDADTLLTYTQSENPVIAAYFPSQSRYTAQYYPNGVSQGDPQDVTTQSLWSDGYSAVASIGANTGLATGEAQGTTTLSASYTPIGGSALSDTAGLAVQQQQQPGSGSTGTLTFQAYNQANIQTLYGHQVGGTLKRGHNIALWTDSVTATLAVSQPPTPTNIPQGGSFAGFINWGIASATLKGVPIQNSAFTFDNPVEPSAYKTHGMNSRGTVSSGNATAVSPGFEEDWSEDGIGYGTSGPQGIMDALTGQKAAVYPKSYQLSATYVVNYTYDYTYWVPGSLNHPGHWATGTASGSSGSLTASQRLWVCGTGAVPVTGTGGHLAVVACLANPQTHP